jgi:hypothetical protein
MTTPIPLESIIHAGRLSIRVVSVPIRVNSERRQLRLVRSIPRYVMRIHAFDSAFDAGLPAGARLYAIGRRSCQGRRSDRTIAGLPFVGAFAAGVTALPRARAAKCATER